MTMPRLGQTVHMMTLRDCWRVRWDMHRKAYAASSSVA